MNVDYRLQWQRSEELIKNASPNADEMLLNGKAPLQGQIVKLPNLAKTFRILAEKGKAGFYTGRIAEAIVELIQSKGGIMELEDLAKHETTFVEPIKYTFAGEVTIYEVSWSSARWVCSKVLINKHQCPPNGQGTLNFRL